MTYARMFVMGLLIGAISLVISLVACLTMEVVEYVYWVPTSVLVIVSVVLAALAGFTCGLSCE